MTNPTPQEAAATIMASSEESAQAVASWLNHLPRTAATPVLVQIGAQEFAGALFTQTRDSLVGSRAYAAGEREYAQRALYLLGGLPPSYLRSSRIVYRFGDGRWYVASWFSRHTPNQFNPFGRMFQLMPISATEHEEEPYREMQARLTTLGDPGTPET